MMRHKAEEHMCMKAEPVQMVISDTSLDAILKEIRCESVAASYPVAGESSVQRSAKSGSVEELRAELGTKEKTYQSIEMSIAPHAKLKTNIQCILVKIRKIGDSIRIDIICKTPTGCGQETREGGLIIVHARYKNKVDASLSITHISFYDNAEAIMKACWV